MAIISAKDPKRISSPRSSASFQSSDTSQASLSSSSSFRNNSKRVSSKSTTSSVPASVSVNSDAKRTSSDTKRSSSKTSKTSKVSPASAPASAKASSKRETSPSSVQQCSLQLLPQSPTDRDTKEKLGDSEINTKRVNFALPCLDQQQQRVYSNETKNISSLSLLTRAFSKRFAPMMSALQKKKLTRFLIANLVLIAIVCVLLATDALGAPKDEDISEEDRWALREIQHAKEEGRILEAVKVSLKEDRAILRRKLMRVDPGRDEQDTYDTKHSFDKMKSNLKVKIGDYAQHSVQSLKEKIKELETSILKDINTLREHVKAPSHVHDIDTLRELKNSVVNQLEHLQHVKSHLKRKFDMSEDEVVRSIVKESIDV